MVIGVHHVWRHCRHADADDTDAVRCRLLPLPQLTSFRLRLRPHGHGHDRGLTLLACLLAQPRSSGDHKVRYQVRVWWAHDSYYVYMSRGIQSRRSE
jgi:hypothetical protein